MRNLYYKTLQYTTELLAHNYYLHKYNIVKGLLYIG